MIGTWTQDIRQAHGPGSGLLAPRWPFVGHSLALNVKLRCEESETK